ncbi:uncharacterized protein LOC100572365 isoform X2 [Acyrthosiphon pisum]|uniref:TAFH domain-containing protein n=1 Tax=Acyrthosiphon pisum TaxID=7029 RepID=A0A8R2B437_ACYPI|nr:uncharacterized protein LOC100572365 isoform X2 [Acyrthosiphon pisum]|eukprot:XP_008180825.2 PREDICTED: uncharacterized protein LOC100572365 isoform X2 [Acyrthosiphon pisum]
MAELIELKLKVWGFEQFVERINVQEIDSTDFLTLIELMVTKLLQKSTLGQQSTFIDILRQLNEKHNKVREISEQIYNIESCKNYLAKLIECSGEQPEPVKTVIQELVDAKVELEQFFVNLLSIGYKTTMCIHCGCGLKKYIEPLRKSLMLNEMKIDGIRSPPPPPLKQTTAVLDNQQQVTESINIPIESCNYNPAETTLEVGSMEADSILPRSMDMGGKNDVAVNEKNPDQRRKRPSIPVSIELCDDWHNIATTSRDADWNSSMTLSDNSSSQSKRQRISSNSSSFKLEYDLSLECTTPVSIDSTSYRRTDDDEEDDNNSQLSNTTQASTIETVKLGQWKPYYCRFIIENIVLKTEIEQNILEWTSDATKSASSIDSHNVLFRERLQKGYETTIQNIPIHSTFCRNQELKENLYSTNNKERRRIAAPTGMVNLYKALHVFEHKHNCKFKFLPSSIGKCLIEYTENADLDLDPLHSVSNNVLDVLRYPLRYGLIPEKYWLDLEMFLESVFLKNNYFDSESTRRVETESGDDTVVQFNFIEGEIEALVFDYWSRSTIDLMYYDESESRQDLKGLLRYLFQRLCILYRLGTQKEGIGLFLTNFRALAKFDLDKDIIPANCLLFLKNNISKVWPDIETTDQNLWRAFFNEIKVNYILTARTFSAMFKKLDQSFEFIMSKAAQVHAIRNNLLSSDVSLWYASTTVSEKRQSIVSKSDVIRILPEYFESHNNVDSVLCAAIDNCYYHHIFLLSRYAILHNIDIATRVLKHTEVQKFLDSRQPQKIELMSYVKLPLSEIMQSKMVSCFRRLYIRDSDKFEVEFEITEFDELLYQSLNELICNWMKNALRPVIGHDGQFSPQRFENLYPCNVICDGHGSLPQDFLRCYAFAISLYAHMYGLNKRESVSMKCFELDCNFGRDVSVYYDKIIAESDDV